MTKYINKIDDGTISEVAEAIRQGRTAVFRTDTVYGIGANAFDERVCEQIYEIKQRPMRKPLVVLVAGESMLDDIVEEIGPIERKLMKKFWPGALTILLKKRQGVLAKTVALNTDYVGFRLPGNEVSRKIIEMAGVPVVAPSANLSGSSTGINMRRIRGELEEKVDYILDDGDIDDDTVSTIIKVEDGKIVIIRDGKIGRGELAEIAPIKGD